MQKRCSLIFMLLFALSCFAGKVANAQTKAAVAVAKKQYAGTWVNKKAKRYLRFFFDAEVAYVTVNDWTGNRDRNKSGSIDAYKAFIQGGKLVLPADSTEHRCPYCEIRIQNGKLEYQCNGFDNYKEGLFENSKLADATIFERVGR